MLLTIDIGNTNIVLGIFNNNKLQNKWRISTDINKTSDEYGLLIRNLINELDKNVTIKSSIISSVVPQLNNVFKQLLIKYFNINPIFVSSETKLNLKIAYPNPREIGADRLVNAEAASVLYKPPLIIIDFGTATTFCFVDKNNYYNGGLILPGISLMLKALHIGTAKLPSVNLIDVDWIIGDTTEKSIQAGIFHQTVGAINHIINLILKNYDSNSKIVLTGGMAKFFKDKINYKNIFNENLTLEGLNIIYNNLIN